MGAVEFVGIYGTLAIRLLLGLVFLSAALDKVTRLHLFAQNITDYGIARRHTLLLAAAFCAIEAGLGLTLVLGAYWRVGLILSAMLLLTFAAVLSSRRSSVLSCSCGGIAELMGGRANSRTRNVVLAATAAIGALGEVSALSLPLSTPLLAHYSAAVDHLGVTVAYLTISLVASGLAAWEIWVLHSRRRRLDTERFGG